MSVGIIYLCPTIIDSDIVPTPSKILFIHSSYRLIHIFEYKHHSDKAETTSSKFR